MGNDFDYLDFLFRMSVLMVGSTVMQLVMIRRCRARVSWRRLLSMEVAIILVLMILSLSYSQYSGVGWTTLLFCAGGIATLCGLLAVAVASVADGKDSFLGSIVRDLVKWQEAESAWEPTDGEKCARKPEQ